MYFIIIYRYLVKIACLLNDFYPPAQVVWFTYFFTQIYINFKLYGLEHFIQLGQRLGHILRQFNLFSKTNYKKKLKNKNMKPQ